MTRQIPQPKPAPHDDTDTVRHHQAFSVSYAYDVVFTHALFDPANPVFRNTFAALNEGRRHRCQVYIDTGVTDARPSFADDVVQYAAQCPDLLELVDTPQLVPGGEQAKNGWNVVQHIIAAAGDAHLCRHSFVVVIGGGSVLDVVGFAASLVHRGVRVIRVPTTVLAQNDAGVGVKTSMDEHKMKNFIGTFAPPHAVLIDFDFLRTLPDKYWFGGLAEAFKVAVIKDRAFFDFLCAKAGSLRERDAATMEQVVRRCAELHLDHIRTSGDPFETGAARPLDFGHWSAHRLEILSNYRLGHGQAVAIGIAMDTYCAWRTGHLDEQEFQTMLTGMEACGLPIADACLARQQPDGTLDILKGLAEFREHLGGKLNITLPNHIGAKLEVHEMDPSVIGDSVRYLLDRAGLIGQGSSGGRHP